MNREQGNAGINIALVVGILIFLAVFLAGFFKNDRVFWDTFNVKSLLRLPCGLTVSNPKPDAKAVFPVVVDGYINACGWNAANGGAGTAQIFDGQGLPVTLPVGLSIDSHSESAPFYFKASLVLHTPPHTDAGNIVLVSTTGLVYSVPISF